MYTKSNIMHLTICWTPNYFQDIRSAVYTPIQQQVYVCRESRKNKSNKTKDRPSSATLHATGYIIITCQLMVNDWWLSACCWSDKKF